MRMKFNEQDYKTMIFGFTLEIKGNFFYIAWLKIQRAVDFSTTQTYF